MARHGGSGFSIYLDAASLISGARAPWPFGHPHNIAQKTEVMVEHFQAVTRHKIGGRAKAMVVTRSRLEAVRYKQSFDRYIKEKGYPINTLVAFSGTVQADKLPDVAYTELGSPSDRTRAPMKRDFSPSGESCS